MSRQISSSLTFFHKFILPGLFAVGIINIGVQYLRDWWTPDGLSVGWMLLIAAAFLAYSLCFFSPLKKVAIDDNNLYVSDYRTEVSLPISEIESVSEFFFSEPRRVTIHLKNPTVFGRKIVFLATYRSTPLAFLYTHPIVSELNELVLFGRH